MAAPGRVARLCWCVEEAWGRLPDLFANVALIECADQTALEETLAAGLDRFVVRRLSETAVVVDHKRLDDVIKLLRRQGHTPKVTQE